MSLVEVVGIYDKHRRTMFRDNYELMNTAATDAITIFGHVVQPFIRLFAQLTRYPLSAEYIIRGIFIYFYFLFYNKITAINIILAPGVYCITRTAGYKHFSLINVS